MNAWLKDLIGNILGRPSGRVRYMTCPRGHITLSKLPTNSQCDAGGCDAVMKPLTEPLWGIFPLSDRVIQLQTQLFKSHKAQGQYIDAYASFLKLNDEQNELITFFRQHFSQDLQAGDGRSIVTVAIARLKKELPQMQMARNFPSGPSPRTEQRSKNGPL